MDDELISPRVRDYLHSLVPPRSAEMLEMELKAEENDFPIIGPVCGYLCYLITRIAKARDVFEMGSGYGYSTAWFAKAVKENGGGVVHHVVWDTELSREAQQHISALDLGGLVEYHVEEAVQALSQMPGQFDLIFNDIEKHDYPDSLPVIKDKLRAGGVLIVDNMLWYGRIFNDDDKSPDTEGVREFTRRITADSDWCTSLIPIRDGMIVAYKR